MRNDLFLNDSVGHKKGEKVVPSSTSWQLLLIISFHRKATKEGVFAQWCFVRPRENKRSSFSQTQLDVTISNSGNIVAQKKCRNIENDSSLEADSSWRDDSR